MTVETHPRLTLAQRLALTIVPRLVWAVLWLLGFTWRFEFIADEGAIPVQFGERPEPEVYCFWHQCVLPATFYFRHSRAVILISSSYDGELITRVARNFGYGAVRGSSTRGASEGLRGLKHGLESGRSAIFTADGPRGPIYRTKMGPIKLAQMTGSPIGAFHVQPEHAWTMRSWDRFMVPKPFSRIVVSWAKPTVVPSVLSAEELESKREELNAAMENARLKALDYFKKAKA